MHYAYSETMKINNNFGTTINHDCIIYLLSFETMKLVILNNEK